MSGGIHSHDAAFRRLAIQQHKQPLDAEDINRPQRHDEARHALDEGRCLAQRCFTTLLHGLGGDIMRTVRFKGAVDHQALIRHTQRAQLASGALGFAQR